MALRSTNYTDELVTAGADGGRIERIRVRDKGTEEIRFSWWKDGRFQTRPLDLEEEDLLPLMQEAIQKGVFSEGFLDQLTTILNQRKR